MSTKQPNEADKAFSARQNAENTNPLTQASGETDAQFAARKALVQKPNETDEAFAKRQTYRPA